MAAAREAVLRSALKDAKRDRERRAASSAQALKDSQLCGQTAAEQLRVEVHALSSALKAAERAAVKAEERAAKARAANAILAEENRTFESKLKALHARLACRPRARRSSK